MELPPMKARCGLEVAASDWRFRNATSEHRTGAILEWLEHTSMTDSTVTKADLVEEVVRVTELPRKESETVVETIFESIIGALQGGDRIEIRGFGSFRTRQRRGRTGRNPKTGAKVEVPPKKIPFFKPSKELKDHVNGGASAAPETGAAPAMPQS
jgi:integration host factor subunit beta